MSKKPIFHFYFFIPFTMTRLLSSLIMGLSLIAITYRVTTQRPIMTTDTTPQTNKGQLTNTITVTAVGEAKTTPDTILMSITVNEQSSTTSAAQTAANTKLTQVRDILTQNKVDESNIQTASLSLNPRYDRNDGSQKLVGYEASQQLTITIDHTPGDTTATNLIDQVSQIDNIRINQITRQVQQKAQAEQDAREAAFANAQAKAQELAKLADSTLGQALIITEGNTNTPTPVPFARNAMAEMALDSSATTSINPGQLTITSNLTITFQIQ